MSSVELARHADAFLRVARRHGQVIDGGTVSVSDRAARVFVVFDVEMALAARARGASDNGVHKHERVEFVIREDYPWRCPSPYLRHDFPTDLPHLTPGRDGGQPRPCLIDGSAGEFFSQYGLVELGVIFLLEQMAIWLRKAAAGQLMDPQQGWEPLPRPEVPGALILDTDFVRGNVNRKGGWTVLKSFYHRTGPADANLGAEVLYLVASRTPTPLYDDPEKLSYTWGSLPSGNARGKTITAVIWPGRNPDGTEIVTNAFLPETVHSLADLKERAAAVGCADQLGEFIRRLETSLAKLVADFPIPIGIVLCVRRPFRLMNRSSNVELVPYAFEVRIPAGRKQLYPDDEAQLQVIPLRPIETTSPALLNDVSGAGPLKPISLIGCGSVGSKVAIHMARAGAKITAVSDSRNLMPHNMARHGVIRDPLPTPKAEILTEDLVTLGQDPKVYLGDVVTGLANREDRRKIAPKGTELLVNTTASLLVREALARPTVRELPSRVAEIALFGLGQGAFVFMEGRARNPTLPDLMATLYASATPAEQMLLFDPAYGLSQVQIGEGCGSLTMQMTDARLSAMTAAATEEVEHLAQAEADDGALAVLLYDQTSRSTTWRRLSVPPFRTIAVNGGRWTLRLSSSAEAKIRGDIEQYPGVETGGYLIGICSARLRTVTVVDVLPAPVDSQRSPTLFTLGTSGAKEAILQRHKASGDTLLDVGTWHSHLNESGASSIDRATARKLAAERAPPAVLLIATPLSYSCIVYEDED